MKELLEIDKKNYDENGSIGRRPSVRGIIIKDGKIAMMHSLKYNYYKLPGGGIEPGETLIETLIREVLEESGLSVIPDGIKEFGYVRRIEKGRIEDIFIQDNYYFLCDVFNEVSVQRLDDYERYEEFTLEFVEPYHAIRVNNEEMHFEKSLEQTFVGMIDRENRVLEMIVKELKEKF